ncbi:MAG: hypothetical protein U0Q16_25855 [Bryobacteraceae bacterium]
MRRYRWLVSLALLAISACSRGTEKLDPAISSDTVSLVRSGAAITGQTPVYVLLENHASRLGQLELALTLVRLYKYKSLRGLVVEGYVDGEPEPMFEWARDGGPEVFPVALRLLEDGEIGAPEFMKAVWPDLKLHPGEVKAQYFAAPEGVNAVAPISLILQMAEAKLSVSEARDVREARAEFERAGPAQQEESARRTVDLSLARDAWAKRAFETLSKGIYERRTVPVEQRLRVIVEVKDRASKAGLLDRSASAAMDEHVGFWQARVASNETMAARTAELAIREHPSPVALLTGAGHGEGVARALRSRKRAHLVLAPQSLEQGAGPASRRAGRKTLDDRIASVTTGLRPSLQSGPAAKLNGSALWTLLHLRNQSLRGGTFGAVIVDSARIERVPSGNGRARVFPVSLKAPDGRRSKEFWVRVPEAGQGAGLGGREAAEEFLEVAIQHYRKENGPRDSGGIEFPGGFTIWIGSTREDVFGQGSSGPVPGGR